jgi:ABC-type branched-subunit amino acid transport system permease subunit
MKRIIGIGIGAVYLAIAGGALHRALGGWAAGFPDVGFWWTVIAVLLTAAAFGAIIGTVIHTRPRNA